jgi:hypothetical protein
MNLARTELTNIIFMFCGFFFYGPNTKAEAQHKEPRAEIPVVESWYPDLTALNRNGNSNFSTHQGGFES